MGSAQGSGQDLVAKMMGACRMNEMGMDQGGQARRQGCRFGCLGVLAAVFVTLGVVVVALILLGRSVIESGGIDMASHGGASGELGEDEMPELSEVWSSGSGEAKVVRIPIRGMIMLDSGSWDMGNSDSALRAIRRARHDSSVQGIILDVDSGGGGITASDILYHELLAFKEEQDGRVIVTLMGDVAASGAYYLALASDTILAHPTTITGSIGVIMQSYNVRELAQKLGVTDVTIKSGANKDMLNPMREVSPEQLALFQKLIDGMYERFIGLVAENRGLPIEQVRVLADGRVFMAQEALDAKLIDAIGYWEDAEAAAAELLDEEAVKVVRYEEEQSIFDLLRGRRGIFGLKGAVSGLLDGQEPRMMYRLAY